MSPGHRRFRCLATLGPPLAAALALAACGERPEATPAPAVASSETPGSAATAPGLAVPTDPQLFPDDPSIAARIEEARRLLRTARFEAAERLLQAVLAESPQSERARFYLGVAIAKQQRYAAASALFTQVLESDRAFAERIHVDHFHGWALYYLGEPQRAKASFLRHVEGVPQEGDSLFGLGLIALDAGDLEEAERRFLAAIALQEGDPALAREVAKAEARMGDVRARQDRLDEAIEWWSRCTARHPDHHEAWHRLARTYARLGRDAESAFATRQWQAALARLGRQFPAGGMGPAMPDLESPDAR